MERIEVLKTVKLGRGLNRTYIKGRILKGKDIIDVIRIELSKKTGTLRKLDPSVEVSSNKEVFVSKPQFVEEEVKTENIVSSDKKKKQSVPKRRGRNVPN